MTKVCHNDHIHCVPFSSLPQTLKFKPQSFLQSITLPHSFCRRSNVHVKSETPYRTIWFGWSNSRAFFFCSFFLNAWHDSQLNWDELNRSIWLIVIPIKFYSKWKGFRLSESIQALSAAASICHWNEIIATN